MKQIPIISNGNHSPSLWRYISAACSTAPHFKLILPSLAALLQSYTFTVGGPVHLDMLLVDTKKLFCFGNMYCVELVILPSYARKAAL